MSYEVTSRHENVLLARIELEIAMTHDQKPSPSREHVRKEIADSESTKPGLVIIKRMEPEFGRGVTHGWAHVYKDEEALRKMEPHHLLVRHGMAEKKVKAAKEKSAPAKAA